MVEFYAEGLTNQLALNLGLRSVLGILTVVFGFFAYACHVTGSARSESQFVCLAGLAIGFMILNYRTVSDYEDLATQYLAGRIGKAPEAKPTSTATSSTADELVKLNSLRQQGAITEEEFAALKKKVL